MLPAATVRRRAGSIGALVLAATMVLSPGTAGAAPDADVDNIVPIPHAVQFAGCGIYNVSTCLTDNSEVTYYMDSNGKYELESGDKNTVRSVLRSEYSPTDLAISYDSSPSFSGGAETDIVYQEGSDGLDSDAVGMAWCDDKIGNYKCDQQYVRIRGQGWIENSPGTVCHETGHAVGLVHGDKASPSIGREDRRLGCMRTPGDDDRSLGAMNKRNINNAYPKP